MRGGRLRTRVTIQQIVEGAPSPLNETAKTWATWREAYADVQFPRGREVPGENQAFIVNTVVCTFRFFEVRGLSETMRIVIDGTPYDIRAIRPGLDRRDATIVECTTDQRR
nr:head-tail adaptor protein [Prosthecomicrobium hirschii]